jgi:DNA ligase D-like protein (predicted 3'-phosphoesterase)
MTDRLATFRSMRDFSATPEPAGGDLAPGTGRFVVQRHRARRLHYDFRLEVDGVLKSWAVPKGPSTDPREKRLARQVEDHPLDYADFEGTIPGEEYGGGTVLVWDIGPYRNLTEDDGREIPVADAVEEGHVKVWLEGDKLRGGYALTRTQLRGDPSNWMLVKVRDEAADARRRPTHTQPESVVSGRTLDEVAEHERNGPDA